MRVICAESLQWSNINRWTELRTAYHVAKLGTVSAAAAVLGFHRATVNRHIDMLEAEIGGKVFIRHARGYTLTEVGQEVLRVAQKTEELIDDLAGRVRGGKTQIEGEIKLAILAPFSSLLMQPVLDFRSKNPQCRVDIHVGEGLAKLEYGEAHIALRVGGKPDHPDYVATHFGDVGFNIYAHDSYVARRGLPAGVADLSGHSFVLLQFPEGRAPFESWITEHVKPDMVALSSPDIGVTLEAISSGVGIGFVGDHEASKRGHLKAVFPANPNWIVPGWIVTHVDLHRTEKVQEMLKCIKDHMPVEIVAEI